MKRRWNSNTWMLLVLGGVLLLTGFDVGRRYLLDAKLNANVESPSKPPFSVGDLAPDFQLPDKTGKKQMLSSLVKRETVLCFLCGCNNCREVQAHLGKLIKLLGPKAPDVISVTSQNKDYEERYREITGLPQTLLYEAHGGGVTDEYRGRPCPRIFILDGQRHVKWIGPSNLELPRPSDVSLPLATALGFRHQGEPESAKPLAPVMQPLPAPTRPNDPNGARGVTPGGAMEPAPILPPGVMMGPNGMMPAHVPVAPGQANPPGVGGAPKAPSAGHDDHAGHGH